MKIVYESSTGFTEKYAKMFAEKTGLECWSMYMAKIKVQKDEDVVYFGWIQQGEISKYKKAAKKFNVLAVCPVGIAAPSERVTEKLKEKNKIGDLPKIFYLHGGYDPEKSVGLQGTLINMVVKDLESKESDLDSSQIQMMNDLKNGADYVDENNLTPLLEWFKES
jgi:flavodoxin